MIAEPSAGTYFDPRMETLDRERLVEHQLERLRAMLREVLASNRFYQRKLQPAGLTDARELSDWEAFRRLPLTTKAELVADQAAEPPFGTNLTYPLERYVKLHQTSGTSGGVPLRWLDTEESWDWWARLWGHVYRGAGVGPGDRIFFAFSFGPFIGFWAAWEGARKVGALTLPGGGQQSVQRLATIRELGATVLLCTPTYALRLAEVAAEQGIDTAASTIRTTIHAGEPGASIPATRARIEAAWGARCFDHCGMTEIGATGFTCQEQSGVHLIESEFIFEVLDPSTLEPVPTGEQGELVITNLGRLGSPLIRYRSGDLVRFTPERCDCGRTFGRLPGGILGRVDDMLIVRGVNIFPSAIEDVVRQFTEVAEYRIELSRVREMAEVTVQIEPTSADLAGALAERVAAALRTRIGLRMNVAAVPCGSLPRFEAKAKRVVRLN